MPQKNLVKIVNKSTGTTYFSFKNKKKVTRKLSFKKYDPKTRTHVEFKEAKK